MEVRLIDQSAIYFTNEMGNGRNHNHYLMPTLIAGSAGGYFKTGFKANLPLMNERFGRPDHGKMGRYNAQGILANLAQAMGDSKNTYGPQGQNSSGAFSELKA